MPASVKWETIWLRQSSVEDLTHIAKGRLKFCTVRADSRVDELQAIRSTFHQPRTEKVGACDSDKVFKEKLRTWRREKIIDTQSERYRACGRQSDAWKICYSGKEISRILIMTGEAPSTRQHETHLWLDRRGGTWVCTYCNWALWCRRPTKHGSLTTVEDRSTAAQWGGGRKAKERENRWQTSARLKARVETIKVAR